MTNQPLRLTVPFRTSPEWAIQNKLKKRSEWTILTIFFGLQAGASLIVLSFGPLAPFLQEDLGITRTQVGFFTSAVYVGNVLFGALCGWLIDKYGIRRFILIGPAAICLSFFMLTRTPSYGIGIVFVMLGGFGYVFVNPAAAKALTEWFSPKMRATSIGIMKSGVHVGSALGAAVLPVLSLLFGWRNGLTFIVVAIAGISIVAAALYRDAPIHVSGQTGGFGWRELRQVVTNKNILLLGCIGMTYSAIQLSTATYLVLFLTEKTNLSVILAGTYLTVVALSGAAGRVLWGIISDRMFHGKRKTVLSAMGLISGILSVSLALVAVRMTGWLLYPMMAIFGFAAFGWMGVYVTFLAEGSSADQAGTGVGFGLSISGLGIILGPPLFGFIVDVTQSYVAAWTTVGIMAMAGGLMAIVIRE